MTARATITVRERGHTYVARAKQYGVQASCTSDPRWAVERCALKCKHFPAKPDVQSMNFEFSDITLSHFETGTYLASWEAQ